ncbi:hypothetical protein B5M47_00395 [candidate division CPR3 bacterium 4484_211]|uniref:Uncharacterized protein n=1 Tax=candidate division CPR3 bacterium 4484_211 TaxID=1968527 RepID=A0A1W9NZW7_UNCC3|nr:MAG: hypothetical protein B5M47_00395 [candidate division CPR3 bacterium 4484_211]
MRYYFIGRYREIDKDLFVNAQEQDLGEIHKYLQTDAKLCENFKYKVFDTRTKKQKEDPFHSVSRASARFDELTIYRFWKPPEDPHFPHEITHLVAHTWGKSYFWQVELDTYDNQKIERKIAMLSTSFMQEGLAIAVDEIVFKRKLLEGKKEKFVDEWCRKNESRLSSISLKDVISFDGFCSIENSIVVPFAGSFSKYLLLNFGVKKFKRMYVALKETLSPQENIAILERVYQKKESQLLREWYEYILDFPQTGYEA